MFENIMRFFKKMTKNEEKTSNSKNTAKERLHLVLVQDRANVSADFLELMKQEIIEVIKKYIEVDESLIDVRLTNHSNEDGTNGAPALYANIPIKNIKETARKVDKPKDKTDDEKKVEDTNSASSEEKGKEPEKADVEESNASPEEKGKEPEKANAEESSANSEEKSEEIENVEVEDNSDSLEEKSEETENKTEE